MDPVIVVFLLLFAILAFGYFYLQRAKTRDAGKATVEHTSADATVTPTDEPRTPTARP